MATSWTSLQRTTVIVCSWIFYNLGSCLVNVIITNDAFLKEFRITPTRLGAFVSLPLVGSVVNSAGVGGLLNRRYGRKRSFQIAATTTILAVCIQIAPFRAFWPLVAGRILFGFGGNLNGRTLGLYLSEISSADDRGRTTILGVGFLPAAVSILSNIVAFCTAFMPAEKSYSWRVANGIQIVPGVVFLLLTPLLPESPRWIASNYPHDHQRLLQTISQLRDKDVADEDVAAEADEISENAQMVAKAPEKQSVTKVLTNRQSRRRLMLAAGALAAGVSAGYPILSSYAVVFYQDLITHNQRQALLLNAGIAVIFALANLYSASIVDKAGRRVMARSYMVGNLILLAGIAGLSVLFPEKSDRRASFVIVTLMVLDMTAFQSLWIGTVEVFSNEILPNDVREIGIGLANILPLTISFSSTQIWPPLQARLGDRAWLVLLVPAAVATVGVWAYWPETSGVSLEELDTTSRRSSMTARPVVSGEDDEAEPLSGGVVKRYGTGGRA